jgi:carbon monoxide dehydrogenase subunit G
VKRATGTIEIAAPLQRVWDVVMDPGRLGEWVTIHERLVGAPELPLDDGSTFEQVLALSGTSFQVQWQLLELHEPHLAAWNGEGPAGSHANVTYRLDATGRQTTRFEYANTFYLPGGLRGWRAGRLLKDDVAERELRASLERLKQLIERGA